MQDDNSIKAMGAFGGGIAASGNVCGILVGGIAMISSIYSRASLDEKEDPRMWSASKRFMKTFTQLAEDSGGITCHDIARVDWSDREKVRAYYKDPEGRRKECIRLVGEAAYELGRLLEQEETGKEQGS